MKDNSSKHVIAKAMLPKPMRLTPAERKRIARAGAAKRWGKKLVGVRQGSKPLAELEPSDAIIVAAARIFGDQGFEKPTMKEIAEAAGIGIPTIYRCFPNKRAMYVQCCAQIFDLYSRYFVDLLFNGSTAAEKIYAYVLGDCFVHLNPNMTRLIHRPVLDNDREIINTISSLESFIGFTSALNRQMDLLLPSRKKDGIESFVLMGTVLGISQLRPIATVSTLLGDTLESVEQLAATCLHSLFPSFDWKSIRRTTKFHTLDIQHELIATRKKQSAR